MKHIYSFFNNEQELIKSVLDIHNDGKPIDCDPMYNQGMFYKNGIVARPKFRFDLNASKNFYDAKDGDATNLPLENNSLQCIILDPPFMFGRHGKSDGNRCRIRYTMFDKFEQLETC